LGPPSLIVGEQRDVTEDEDEGGKRRAEGEAGTGRGRRHAVSVVGGGIGWRVDVYLAHRRRRGNSEQGEEAEGEEADDWER
jgi:hypothetical protein